MTLREIGTEVRARAEVLRDTYRVAQYTAWWSEAYSRHEKLPKLERILNPSTDMTPLDRVKQQEQALLNLAMMTGGQAVEIKH